MKSPEYEVDVIIRLAGGQELVAHTDDWLPDGAFIDDNYNPCGCDACRGPNDTGYYFPVSWRPLSGDTLKPMIAVSRPETNENATFSDLVWTPLNT